MRDKTAEPMSTPRAGKTGLAEGLFSSPPPDAPWAKMIGQTPAGMIEMTDDGCLNIVSPQFCVMTGYAEAELRGCTLWDVLDRSSHDRVRAALEMLSDSAEEIRLLTRYRTKNGTSLDVQSAFAALRDTSGQMIGTSVMVTVMGMAHRPADPMFETIAESRLRRILDHTNSFIGVLTPDGTLIEANRPALELGAVSREDVIGRKFWECFWWADDPSEVARLKQAIADAAQGRPQRFDALVRVAGDQRLAIDFSLSPVSDETGKIVCLVPSGFDISARKQSEERLAYAMREVNHRSKNLLAVVQSMLRQMQPADGPEFVQEFGARLRALSACQDLLVNSPSETLGLEALIRGQVAHFQALAESRLHLSGPAINLTPDAAQSLGMAIYELATNAAKYGALLSPEGQITVEWHIVTDATPRLSLIWREGGGPQITGRARRGFGSVVLEDMLGMALSAHSVIAFHPSGLEWRLDCPLEQVAAS